MEDLRKKLKELNISEPELTNLNEILSEIEVETNPSKLTTLQAKLATAIRPYFKQTEIRRNVWDVYLGAIEYCQRKGTPDYQI